MKIILTVNQTYFPPLSGSSKGNRLLSEWLAQKHEVMQVIVPGVGTAANSLSRTEVLNQLEAQNIAVNTRDGVDIFKWNGVEVHGVIDASRLRAYLVEQINKLNPDWVLVSSEDPSLNLLDAALKAAPGRVVYLVHTLSFLPFGPQAFFPSQSRSKLIGQVAGIAAISQYVADYIKKWSNLDSTVIYWPWYGAGPFPNFGNFDNGYVTMINPCAFKGLSIFLDLARNMPNTQFAAVPTWGTTAADVDEMRKFANIEILNPRPNIDEIFSQTRVLLMPSLWEEAFGMSVVEAQLRGIPVLSSPLGGLPEAKQGTDYLLPVRAIERFSETLDANMLSVPIVPEQDTLPWQQALSQLLSDRALYQKQSHAALDAATKFNNSLSFTVFDNLLTRLKDKSGVGNLVMNRQMTESKVAQKSNGKADILSELTPEQKALLMLRLSKKSANSKEEKATPQSMPIKPVLRDGDLPLSFAQQRLWFLDQLTPGNAFYIDSLVLRLKGPLDITALEKTFSEIVRRHEILRTTYPSNDGQPVQHIGPPTSWSLPVHDLQPLADEQETEIARLADQEAQSAFNLAEDPPLRTTLLKLGAQEHVLLLTLHQIAADVWSLRIFIREMKTIYNAFREGRPSPLPELPFQYADFAHWQQGWLQSKVLSAELTYWQKQLGGSNFNLQLPTDRPRSTGVTRQSDKQTVVLPKPLIDAVKTLCHQERVTIFMVLMAAFKVLLYRYSRQEEIIVGSPIAGRSQTELESLIGWFANTLVLRSDLSGNPTFRALLARVRVMTLDAYANQDLPFEKVVELLQPERNLARNPLFQVVFLLYNLPATAVQTDQLTITSQRTENSRTTFDLIFHLWESNDQVEGWMQYDKELFEQSTIKRLLDHYQILLENIIANPDQPIANIPLISPVERRQLLSEWNNIEQDYPHNATIIELFEEQVRSTPTAIAIIDGTRRLTFAELDQRADCLAQHLVQLNVEHETIVGIFMDRSLDTIVAMLAIMKAGGAYLPLDPNYPVERISFMISDAGVKLLLTTSQISTRLTAQHDAQICLVDELLQTTAQSSSNNLKQRSTADSIAYVIYTSGSTGKPKGVLGLHRSTVNRFHWMWQRYPFQADDICCQKTSLSFVDSIWEIFGPMLKGVPIVIVPEQVTQDIQQFVTLLATASVTRLVLVPSLLRVLLESYPDLSERLPKLRFWITSGEALTLDLAKQFLAVLPDCRLLNLYGSSEVAADVTYYEVGDLNNLSSVPIGQPIANIQIYILDAQGEPTPVGVSGELHVGGVGLARGYLNRPDLTEARFINNPFDSGRLYRTGDMARWLPNGIIEYQGRIDHQVKVRGFRIELGEIEALLAKHQAIKQTIVVAREDLPGDTRLVAYLTLQPASQLDPSQLHSYLREKLPEYMVPAAFVLLNEFPLTPSGKINRNALPAPEQKSVATQTRFVSAETETEEELVALWQKLLGVKETISVMDSFFNLGGHSLMAMRLLSRIHSTFAVEIPIQSFFRTPNIRGLAEIIEEQLLSSNTSKFDEMMDMLEGMDDEKAAKLLAYDEGIDQH